MATCSLHSGRSALIAMLAGCLLALTALPAGAKGKAKSGEENLPAIAKKKGKAAKKMKIPAGFVPVEVARVVTLEDQGNAVLLTRPGSETVLPIFIGDTEALAIAMRLRGERAPRPLTHDLLEYLVPRLGGKLVHVLIDDVRHNVFLGRLQMKKGAKKFQVDARPSDAIALGLGMGVPIYVSQGVMDRAALDLGNAVQRETTATQPKLKGQPL